MVRVERPRLGDDPIAQQEMRCFPASLLCDLPLASTLLLQIPGHDHTVAVATSRERAEIVREAGLTVFDPAEWSAIVVAAESDRLWPSDLRELCDRKASEPGSALDVERALAGARADAPRGWSVGKVLDRLGAHLVAVEC